ncbi:hypothetical protein [Flavobacterium sp. FlaQc-48]|uniref:hypothetical protein n=1 Tax=Flavobacterium sp. FlaQc-48 TaxID=3374181 RepID=UPI003757D838
MKIIKTVFFTICLTVLNVVSVFAQILPPPDDGEDPDIVPIDNYVVLLIIAGMILGMTIIYKNKIKKASM